MGLRLVGVGGSIDVLKQEAKERDMVSTPQKDMYLASSTPFTYFRTQERIMYSSLSN